MDFGQESQIHSSVYSPGVTKAQLVDIYNKWTDYDEEPHDYRGPQRTAEAVQKYFPNDHNISIVDVGAGSGQVGKQLTQMGYTNLTAIDAAREFLSKSGNVYKTKHLMYLGPDTKKHIEDDIFDCTVTCGVFTPNHLNPEDFIELIRITKPGGVIVTTLKEKYLSHDAYRDKLEPYMEMLEKQQNGAQGGAWIQLERMRINDYCCDEYGVVYVHRVLISGEPPKDD